MIRLISSLLVSIACVYCFLAPPAESATPADTTDIDTTSVLPDIAPREVEIRGEMQTTFPALQRQPLIGFNPPPRVPTLTSDRRPYIGTYRQDAADLPGSPLRQPDAPSRFFSPEQPLLGEAEATTGRYFDRRIYIRTSVPVQERISVSTRFDYFGTEGHNPFQGETADAAADAFSGELGVQARGDRLIGGAKASGLFTTYHLFGARHAFEDPGFEGSETITPEREGQGITGAAWLQTRGTGLFSADARVEGSALRFESSQLLGQPSTPLFSIQQRAQIDVNAALDVRNIATFSMGGSYEISDVESSTLFDGLLQRFDAGARISTTIRRTVSLQAGIRAFGFQDETAIDRPSAQRFLYVSPEARADWYPRQGLHLYVQQQPGTTSHSLQDLFSENPYQAPEPRVRPSVRLIDTEVGVRTYLGPAQFAVHAGFREMPHFLFFEGTGDAIASAQFEAARIVQAGGNVSVVLPAGFHASLSGTYREGQLTDSELRTSPDGAELGTENPPIPYFSPIVGTAALSWSFDDRNGLIQLSGLFEGERYRDRFESNTVNPFLSLNASASYHITYAVALLGRVDNIVSTYTERWEEYPEAPTSVSFGLRIRW